MEKSKYLDILQIYRGVAALLIVVHHSKISIDYYHNYSSSFLDYFGMISRFGVDFFFVLSGFIITYSNYNKRNAENRIFKYYINRILRIYIPYLPIGLLIFFLYLEFPSLSSVDREINYITSFTLIPINGGPALGVAWTLIFEMMFYTLFIINLISNKAWNIFVIFWISIIILVNFVFKIDINSYFLSYLVSPNNFAFILGYFVCMIYIKNYKINYNIILLITIFLCVFFAVDYYIHFIFNDHFNHMVFLIFCSLLIFYSINKIDYSFNKLFVPMMIGNASYSIYLTHNSLQSLFYKFFPIINEIWGVLLSLIIILILSFLIGYIYYYIFENKIMKLVKRQIFK